MTIWAAVLLVSLTVSLLMTARILIHYFQLESYQFPGYFRTLRRNFLRSFVPGFILNVVFVTVFILGAILIPEENDWLPALLVSAAVLGAGFAIRSFELRTKAKKPLVYTARIKRLYVVSAVVILLLLLLFTMNGGWRNGNEDVGIFPKICTFFFLTFPVLLPFWIALCGLLAWPIEKGISELYFRDAQKILRNRPDLIRIGITGSWGKTSVKFILGTLLEEKYHTLVTPASYNTPMGVTKVIRSSLEPGHRVFVAEMGARHVGDIREMCRLVHPEIGILTSVGPQHLDTFKTLDRIKRTKYELMEAIPEDGLCFFADDNGICRELYLKTDKRKTLSGLEKETDDLWAEDIRISEAGSSFTICTQDEKIPCQTTLLGELNIRNILLCSAVCLKLGMSGDQIARGIAKLKPIEHRLQLIPNPGGLTVIDDAFNSNIRGAEQAFRVLKECGGHRFLVTPGMVELGEQEREMNERFGELAADCCDTAILVGRKRSEAIARGMIRKGFDQKNLIIVNSLEEATTQMKAYVRSGDTVLFENDLPDNYTE